MMILQALDRKFITIIFSIFIKNKLLEMDVFKNLQWLLTQLVLFITEHDLFMN